jgi:hypothetical protein
MSWKPGKDLLLTSVNLSRLGDDEYFLVTPEGSVHGSWRSVSEHMSHLGICDRDALALLTAAREHTGSAFPDTQLVMLEGLLNGCHHLVAH